MIKKIVIFLFCIILFFHGFSQDYIVTFSNDTIKCKIEKVKKSFIKYTLNSNSAYVVTDTILAYKINGESYTVIAHKDVIPWSDSAKYIVSVSAGVGINHCGAGVRSIIGKQGLTGLMLSAGSDGENFLWQVGITGRIMNAYALLSYGTQDYYKLFNSKIQDDEHNIRGITMEIGYLFYFGKEKRFFVNAALDASRYFYTQHYSYDPKTQEVWDIGFGFDAGVGVRF